MAMAMVEPKKHQKSRTDFAGAYQDYLHEHGAPITDETVEALADRMKRLGFQSACAAIGVDHVGMREYLVKHPDATKRVTRERALYLEDRIKVVEEPGDGKGASAKGKGNLAIVTAFDVRFQPKQRIDHVIEGEVVHRAVFAPVDVVGSKALTAADRKALPVPGGPASDVDELLDGDADSMTLDIELGGGESVESEPALDCEVSEPLTIEENGVDRE